MTMEKITLDREPIKEKKSRKSYTREYKHVRSLVGGVVNVIST